MEIKKMPFESFNLQTSASFLTMNSSAHHLYVQLPASLSMIHPHSISKHFVEEDTVLLWQSTAKQSLSMF